MDKTALVSPLPATPVIKILGFNKAFKTHQAVKDVDLEVRRGELYGLLGPDGSGKSSILKCIAGVMTFDAGELDVFNVALNSEAAAEKIKDRIGFMPQGLGLNLYADLTVEENINFFARLRLVAAQDLAVRKKQLLDMTRLTAFRDRPMKKLSGGMKQKLGLICTLIHAPELLILDEPTTGVDPVSRRDFWAILLALLHERRITALVTTAYMDEASRFDRVSMMYEGKILAEGEPANVCASVQGTVVMLEVPEQARALVILRRQFEQVQMQGKWIRVFVSSADNISAIRRVKSLLSPLVIENIHTDDTELEDAFFEILKKNVPVENIRHGEAESPAFMQQQPPAPATKGLAICAQQLSKHFDGFTAVASVNFQVRQGEIFGLLGANGAGKTTVIKMLTGIVPPSGGGGQVAGVDLTGFGRVIKQHIGYMSQQFSLYTDLTVVENIWLYAGIYGLRPGEARTRCQWISQMAGLSEVLKNRTSDIPVGMRQRLALGCALLHRPRVLFLDEPTSGIDPIGRQQFWRILFQLSREEGVAVLVTTHYMSEAEHCDQLALMHAGRIVANAAPEVLKREMEKETGHVLVLETDEPDIVIRRLAELGFQEPEMFGRHIHILSQAPQRDKVRLHALLDDGKLLSIQDKDLSMDDVFVHRVKNLELHTQ